MSFIIFISRSSSSYKPSSIPIPRLYEPEQLNLPPEYKLQFNGEREIKDSNVFIHAQAFYKIHGRIISIMPYYMGVSGILSPMDIGIVWGELVKKENYSQISCYQSGRVLYYKPKDRSLYDLDYIKKHTANMHIIPADKNVELGLKRIKKEDEIYMEGYLVNIESYKDGKLKMYWNTSMSRDDTGMGACELMYVTRLVNKYGEYISEKNRKK